MAQARGNRSSQTKFSRQKREAERFVRFFHEYQRNGGNSYRAALTAGYSERMARAKSFRLTPLARAAEQLERMGLAIVARSDSYPFAHPFSAPGNGGGTVAASMHSCPPAADEIEAQANGERKDPAQSPTRNSDGPTVVEGVEPQPSLSGAVERNCVSYQNVTHNPATENTDSEAAEAACKADYRGESVATEPRVYGFAQPRRKGWRQISYPVRSITTDVNPDRS